MSIGDFDAPVFAATLAADSHVQRTTSAYALKVLSDFDFETLQYDFPRPHSLEAIVDDARSSAHLLVVMSDMTVGPGPCITDDIRQLADRELPGIAQFLCQAQVSAGYGRALFERPFVGWVGECLVVTVPSDSRAALDALGTVIGQYRSWVLESPPAPFPVPETPGSEGVGRPGSGFGGDGGSGDDGTEQSQPREHSAQILHMPFRGTAVADSGDESDET